MQWWVGIGLIVAWIILYLFMPRGWTHLLLIAGVCVLIVQIAAYRKTKAHTSR